jgi:uncharacterized protein YkvS
MKTRLLKMFLGFALMLCGTLVSSRALADEQVITVAVFDFDSKGEGIRDLGSQVATLVNANLSANPKFVTVERAELEKILSEQELGLSGTISLDSAAKVGQLTGAKVLITGRVFKVNEQTIIVAKVISSETGRVYGEIVQGTPSVSIVDLSSNLAVKVGTDIFQKSDTLLAKVETRDDLVAKIKQSLNGKTLPVVSVNINERSYGPHIIDPAAKTELSLILQQCGFKLADAGSTLRPTLEISGDAFSAYGMQKGNLVSCKSHIELTVRDIATGNIDAVDSQTSVGVDVSEETAGKTALDNAADELAERLLPKLVK